MNRIAWLITPSGNQVLVALRLCIAVALALYLSILFDFSRPYWASLEVAVMMQPVPGQAVARVFARAGGTLIAGCVALLIDALFFQSYVLSAAALAFWVGLCSFGANLRRGAQAYGFAIAGFVTGLIVVLSHFLSASPFHVAEARVSEALTAAGSVAFVNLVLSPPTGTRSYLDGRLALLRGIASHFKRLSAIFQRDAKASSESAPEALHPALQALISQTLALEQTRQYVRYESPEFANFDRLARRLDYDILALISATSSLHIYLANLGEPVDTRAVKALAEPAERLHADPKDWEAVKAAFDEAYAKILAIAREPAEERPRARRLPDWVAISRALSLASRFRAVMVTHGLLVAERRNPSKNESRRSEFSQPVDFKNAARNGARTFIAICAGGFVWVHFHNQVPATILMILLSALTTILPALTPNPASAVPLFARGLLAAAIGSFCIDFLFLPPATSFAMLMLAMMPFVFVAGLAFAVPEPVLTVPGRISVLLLSLLVHPVDAAYQGRIPGLLPAFPIWIQLVMGIAGAVTVALLAFLLIFPVSPRQRLREQLAGVFKELGEHIGRHNRQRFETRMYDRLNALEMDETDQPIQFSARQAVQATVNMGLETRALMVLVRRLSLPAELRQAIRDEIGALRSTLTARYLASAEKVSAHASAFHGLAGRLLEYALGFEHDAERRLGIRAAICAELTASAMTDYVRAFDEKELAQSSTGQAAEAN